MRLPIFDPRDVPFRGLNSYAVPSSLEAGQFQELVGVRADDGSLRLRAGQYEEQSDARTTGTVYIPDIVPGGGINEGTFYGGMICRLTQSGDLGVFAAIEVSTDVIGIFWAHYDGTVWSGWGRYTAGTIETGATNTMSIPTFGYMSFTPVPNGSGGIEGIVVQSGAEVPKWLNNPIDSATMFPINDVAFPKQALSHAPVATGLGFLAIRSDTFVAQVEDTHYNANGTFDPATAASDEGSVAASGSAPDQTILFTSGGATGTSIPTVGDYGWAQMTTAADLTGAKQVWIVCDPSDYSWFTCYKWYLTEDTAGDLLIHDPSDFKDTRTVIGIDGDKLLISFSLDDHAGKDLSDITGVKLEVSNAKATAGATLRVYAVIGSGNVRGMRRYAGSFYAHNSRSESAAVNYDPIARTEALINLGGGMDADVRLPWDERLFYSMDVPIFAPTQAQAQAGVTTYRLYAQDIGEGDIDPEAFFHIGDTLVTLYDSDDTNGTVDSLRAETVFATFGNSETAWSEKADSGTFVDDTEKPDKDFQLRKPGPYNQSTPRGTHQIFAGGRMYVCGVRGTSNALRNNAVLVSEKDQPLRFAYVSPKSDGSIDPDGGIMFALEDENGLRLIAVSTSLIGVPTVYCFTDKALYTIEQFSPVKIADKGTVAPWSVASANGVLYWVDQDMIVTEAAASIRGLSRYKVHDILEAVPAARRKFMSGCVHEGRYYLAHADASSNENWRVLVYNQDVDQFESDDKVPTTVPCSMFFNWVYGSEGRLMFFTKNGQLWEYEREGTVDDNGTDIPLVIKSYRLLDKFQRIRVGEAEIVCADQDSETLTVTRTVLKPTASVVGTMSLDAGGSETSLWRVDKTADAAAQEPMASGCGIDVALSGDLNHPWHLESWYQKVSGGGQGKDQGQ